jgi:hypothetical protein
MRNLGLGIRNSDLEGIVAASFDGPASDETYDLEKMMHEAVNAKRKENGLAVLAWNDALAGVAREHSQNLAKENQLVSALGRSCDFPIIHHEGLDFGASNGERLNKRGIYYFSKAGENIALVSRLTYKVELSRNDPAGEMIDSCSSRRSEIDRLFRTLLDGEEQSSAKLELIRQELTKRADLTSREKSVQIVETTWFTAQKVIEDTVEGWMDSPGHRKNILDGEYNEAGIGSANVNGYLISTQVFIKKADCGYKGGSCCEKPGYYPFCYVPYKCDPVSAMCQ